MCLAAETGSSVPQLSRRPTTARPRLDAAGLSLPLVSSWILRQGQDFVSANLRRDRRVRNAPHATMFGLAPSARGRTIAALLAADLTTTDSGTGLAPSALAALRGTGNGPPLSVLFLDLDGFKAINDSHGHLCRGRALVEAAAVIRGSARDRHRRPRFWPPRMLPNRPKNGCALPLTRVPLYGAGAGRPTVEVDAERRPRSAR